MSLMLPDNVIEALIKGRKIDAITLFRCDAGHTGACEFTGFSGR